MLVLVKIFNSFGLVGRFLCREQDDQMMDLFARADNDLTFEFDYVEEVK